MDLENIYLINIYMNEYSKDDIRYNFHIKDSKEYNELILPMPFYNKHKSNNNFNIGVEVNQNIDTYLDLNNLKDTKAGYFYDDTRLNINNMNNCDNKCYIDNYKTPKYVEIPKEKEKKKFNKYVYNIIETFADNYEDIKKEFYIIMLCIIIFAFMLV